MESSLNPLAQEWRPDDANSSTLHHPCRLPHNIYHTAKQPELQAPQQPVVGFPPQLAAAQYNEYFILSQPTFEVYQCFQHDYGGPIYSHCGGGVPAGDRKAPAEYRQKPVMKRVFVPPRLRYKLRSFQLGGRENGKKIWKARKKTSDDGAAAVDGGDSTSPVSGNTTVMIKNIPNQYRRDSFMDFLDKYCLESHLEYDFLYLPMDFRTNDNYGYAFVNFTTAAAAAKIREVLKNYRWGVLKTSSGFFTSRKICDVTWARIQGKNELVKHFQISNFMCSRRDYLPAVFSPPRNGSPDGAVPEPIGKMVGTARLQPKAG